MGLAKNKLPTNIWYYYLNKELIKKEKPCLPNDQVHIKKRRGCYKVYAVSTYGFDIEKNRERITLPWSEFQSKKGTTLHEHLESEWDYHYKKLMVLAEQISIELYSKQIEKSK